MTMGLLKSVIADARPSTSAEKPGYSVASKSGQISQSINKNNLFNSGGSKTAMDVNQKPAASNHNFPKDQSGPTEHGVKNNRGERPKHINHSVMGNSSVEINTNKITISKSNSSKLNLETSLSQRGRSRSPGA